MKKNYVNQQRHWGLDVARSMAILSVIYGHSALFFYPFHSLLHMSFFAVVGVEVFFVLSGFLIGTILLKMDEKDFNFSKVVHFWGRRWLRTLPVYFFVLFVILTLKSEFFWHFFIFAQNYKDEALALFPVTWSLSIEEWFYLLFPLLMLIGASLLKGIKLSSVVALCAITMLLSSAFLRLQAADGSLGWDVVRKFPHLRLDVIGYGILLAYFNKIYPAFLKGKLYFLLCLSVLLISGNWLYHLYMASVNYETATANFTNSTLFFLVMSFCSVAIVSLCLYFPKCSVTWLRHLFYFISITSYSTYLVHFQIMNLFGQNVDSYKTAVLWFFISLLLIYLVSIFLYLYVEKPFLLLRSKLFPR